MTEPFVVDPVRTVATGGVVRPANGCTISSGRVIRVGMPRPWLARIQVVEYLRAFMLGRAGSSRLGGLILISGAFGVFRRDVLVDVGGYDVDCIGEDIEIVLRIHGLCRSQGRDYRVTFLAEPTCWSEVPESTAVLARQRRRWHRGIWEALWKYRGMLFNPRYGRLGFLVLPWFWAFELAAPLIELGGLVLVFLAFALGIVDGGYAVLFLAVAYGYALVVSLAFLAVEEIAFHRYPGWRNLLICVAASVIESFGYRQLTAVWRCRGAWDGMRRAKAEWGAMPRTGFHAQEQAGTAVPSARGARPDEAA